MVTGKMNEQSFLIYMYYYNFAEKKEKKRKEEKRKEKKKHFINIRQQIFTVFVYHS
jgi:hypothetical protein